MNELSKIEDRIEAHYDNRCSIETCLVKSNLNVVLVLEIVFKTFKMRQLHFKILYSHQCSTICILGELLFLVYHASC